MKLYWDEPLRHRYVSHTHTHTQLVDHGASSLGAHSTLHPNFEVLDKPIEQHNPVCTFIILPSLESIFSSTSKIKVVPLLRTSSACSYYLCLSTVYYSTVPLLLVIVSILVGQLITTSILLNS